MKTKTLIIIICCVVLAFFALGAAGVIRFADEKAQAADGGDRLIGFLITKESLYETDAAESIWSDGRIYARLTGEDRDNYSYVFEEIDGIRFLAPTFTGSSNGLPSHGADTDAEVTEVHQSVSVTDEGESFSLSGTIYVCDPGDECILYFNPVYQTPSGEVYAVSGDSMGFGPDSAGAGYTVKNSEKHTETANGAEKSFCSEFEISMRVVSGTEKVSILQFGGNDELLGKAEYAPGEAPERIDTLPGARYIIVESASADGVSRELFEEGDEFLTYFLCRDDGICAKQTCEIVWIK